MCVCVCVRARCVCVRPYVYVCMNVKNEKSVLIATSQHNLRIYIRNVTEFQKFMN